MVIKYLGKLAARAAEGSILLTDRLTILIVPFATLVIWALGAKMTTSLQETLLLGVAITVLAVVILRLVAASYFVWRDDQAAKADLRNELAAPERHAEAAMKAFTIDARKELSNKLARLVSIAAMGNRAAVHIPNLKEQLPVEMLEIDSRINQLSYDVPVRVAAIQLRDYCTDILSGGDADHDRLWAQRKLTFRILHKEDQISDLMSLIELEILLEDAKGAMPDNGDSEADNVMADLKKMIRQLGDNFHKREIQDSLRKLLRGKGFR